MSFEPIVDDIDIIDRVASYLHYTHVNNDIDNVLKFNADSDIINNKNNIILHMFVNGLSLVYSKHYINSENRQLLLQFAQHIQRVANLLCISDKDFVQNVIDFEYKLAKCFASTVTTN